MYLSFTTLCLQVAKTTKLKIYQVWDSAIPAGKLAPPPAIQKRILKVSRIYQMFFELRTSAPDQRTRKYTLDVAFIRELLSQVYCCNMHYVQQFMCPVY